MITSDFISHTVIILAAGKEKRWSGDIPKQLVDVNGVPLIVRTFNQVVDIFGVAPFVITNNQDISNQFNDRYLSSPENSDFTVETLLSTSGLWQGRVVVLLGDTYYEDYVLTRIRDDDSTVMFYGRLLEIYAMAFNHYIYLGKCLNTSLAQAKEGIGFGKLWHIWYLANGYPVDQHTLPDVGNKYFKQLHPDSITMDIDTLEDYEKLKELLGVRASV